jgi:hypothetical protein
MKGSCCMGYYTHYHLEFSAPEDTYETIKEEVGRCITAMVGADPYEFEDLIEMTVEWKWYDHEEDMKRIAKMFPTVYFTLEGEGEDRGDYWVKQFHDNEYYESYAEIIEPKRKW